MQKHEPQVDTQLPTTRERLARIAKYRRMTPVQRAQASADVKREHAIMDAQNKASGKKNTSGRS